MVKLSLATRNMYLLTCRSEIFARWKLHDLTLGLYYLSRREGNAWDLYGKVSRPRGEDEEPGDGGEDKESFEPAKEIDVCEKKEIELIAQLLRTLELLLCTTRASKLPLRKGLELLKSKCQAHVLWADAKSLKASLLRPAFAVLRCDELKSIVVTIRGTRSFKVLNHTRRSFFFLSSLFPCVAAIFADFFFFSHKKKKISHPMHLCLQPLQDTLTDLVGGSVPFHYSPGGGSESPVLGYAHNG